MPSIIIRFLCFLLREKYKVEWWKQFFCHFLMCYNPKFPNFLDPHIWIQNHPISCVSFPQLRIYWINTCWQFPYELGSKMNHLKKKMYFFSNRNNTLKQNVRYNRLDQNCNNLFYFQHKIPKVVERWHLCDFCD